MTVETKQVVEFGVTVTLYRVIGDDGWSTLWHSDEARAVAHYRRHAEKVGR